MEALAALGLAGNVVQFIQFASEVVTETREAYRSADDASAQHLDLETVAEDLRKLISPLQASAQASAGAVGDLEFRKLLGSCNEAASELHSAIQELKVKDGPHRKWRSFGKALIWVWKREKISSFQKRLSDLRNQIQFHIVENLRKQQCRLYTDLKHLHLELTSMNVDRDSKLDVIGMHVKSIQHSNSMLPTKGDLEDVSSAIQTSTSAISEVSKEVEILRSLSFESMEDRGAKIVEAYSTTFEWVFKSHRLPSNDVRSRIGLGRWLRSGGGIFWVSGKAGSGKSTLMKWLYNDPRTSAEIQNWAKGAELVTASFYFWNAGTDMQKSQQGLLQSLLYELLSKCAQLIPVLCPNRWDSSTNPNSARPSSPWSCSELTAAFSRLSNAALASTKFCFFIDGLDEYDGDHFDLIEIMFKAVKSSHIKICLSSRPWNCFEDAFGQNLQRKLYLQDLTREDIEIYAKAKLAMPRYSPSNGKDKILYQQLIVDIGDRAQGVFLWVYLVVRSLREGLADGDDVSMLQKRLQSLPTDLELYFKHILASVDLIHKEKVGSMFQVAVEANEPLLLMSYSFMDEDNPDFAISLPINRMGPREVLDRQKLMRRRINGRSKGLLEATELGDSPYPIWKVDFLHRTVRDFLRTKSIEAMLESMAALDRGTQNICYS